MFFKRTTQAVPDTAVADRDPNAPVMSLRNVEKSVPQGGGPLFVLRRITLDITPGEFVSVMGPSGAGKSTLLHILEMHDGAVKLTKTQPPDPQDDGLDSCCEPGRLGVGQADSA